MPLYQVYCYRIVEAAVVELDATSHDVACEIALELFDRPDVHFAPLAEPLDLAMRSPVEAVISAARVDDEDTTEDESWQEG